MIKKEEIVVVSFYLLEKLKELNAFTITIQN